MFQACGADPQDGPAVKRLLSGRKPLYLGSYNREVSDGKVEPARFSNNQQRPIFVGVKVWDGSALSNSIMEDYFSCLTEEDFDEGSLQSIGENLPTMSWLSTPNKKPEVMINNMPFEQLI